MKKKLLLSLVFLFMFSCFLVGCGKKNEQNKKEEKVVCENNIYDNYYKYTYTYIDNKITFIEEHDEIIYDEALYGEFESTKSDIIDTFENLGGTTVSVELVDNKIIVDLNSKVEDINKSLVNDQSLYEKTPDELIKHYELQGFTCKK